VGGGEVTATDAVTRRPRILLVNHWHDDNKGDGAITAATVSLLQTRYPEADIDVVGLLEDVGDGQARSFRHLRRTHQELTTGGAWLPSEHSTRQRGVGQPGMGPRSPQLGPRVALAVWLARTSPWALSALTGIIPRRVRDRLADVDLVVALGGSNIYDDPAVLAPATLARLLSVLYVPWAAQRCGIAVVGIGHTLGPLPRRSGRRMVRRVLRGWRSLAVRDPRSLELGRHLGLPVAAAPDVAFALGSHPSAAVGTFCARLPEPMGRSLLVLPRQHPSAGPEADRRFLVQVAETCRRLVAAGVVDQIVVGAHCLGPTAIEDDRTSVKRLLPLLTGLPVVHLDLDLAPQEQVALYGRAALTLSVRLHGSILAMVGGSPAFTVAYFSTKAEGAMADAGLPHAWADFADFTTGAAVPVLTGLTAPGVRAALAERMAVLADDLSGRLADWPDLGTPAPDGRTTGPNVEPRATVPA
jgi:polysaccharide pyruvyl transferase WcaK-like protein